VTLTVTISTFVADIAYSPLLGKAFGGCAGVIDVGVVPGPLDQAIDPLRDSSVAKLNETTAARCWPESMMLRSRSTNPGVADLSDID
jgi:hypothetical protein